AVTPLAALADVDEMGLHVDAGLRRELAEQRRFLGAGDDYRRVALQSVLIGGYFGPAEIAMNMRATLDAEGCRQPSAVERHRALAIARQDHPVPIHHPKLSS